MWLYITDSRREAEHLVTEVLAPALNRDPALLADLPIGSAEHCCEVLARYADAGAREVLLWPIRDGIHQLEQCVDATSSIVGGAEGEHVSRLTGWSHTTRSGSTSPSPRCWEAVASRCSRRSTAPDYLPGRRTGPGGAAAVAVPGAATSVAKHGLKNVDPTRYGALSHPGDTYCYGLFTQVARALRSPDPATRSAASRSPACSRSGSRNRRSRHHLRQRDPAAHPRVRRSAAQSRRRSGTARGAHGRHRRDRYPQWGPSGDPVGTQCGSAKNSGPPVSSVGRGLPGTTSR